MNSTDVEFDESETSKILRDEYTDANTNYQSKTIVVDSYGIENVLNPPKE